MTPDQREIGSIKPARVPAFVAVLFLFGSLAFITISQRGMNAAQGQLSSTLRVTSTFSDGEKIAQRYTCNGAGISPELHWTPGPAGTRSFALVMHDPDAPADFTHWMVYNIPPSVHELAAGASENGDMPPGSAEGINSFGRTGYGGPCPPPGKPHHYIFSVYALNVRLSLPAGASRDGLESAMRQHVIAEGRLVGVYGR